MKATHGALIVVAVFIAVLVAAYYFLGDKLKSMLPGSTPTIETKIIEKVYNGPVIGDETAYHTAVEPISVPIVRTGEQVVPVASTPTAPAASAGPTTVTAQNQLAVAKQIVSQLGTAEIATGNVSAPRVGDVWDPVTQSYVYPIPDASGQERQAYCDSEFGGQLLQDWYYDQANFAVKYPDYYNRCVLKIYGGW